jgi:hypothetical protein
MGDAADTWGQQDEQQCGGECQQDEHDGDTEDSDADADADAAAGVGGKANAGGELQVGLVQAHTPNKAVLLYSSTICRCRWWLHQPPPHRFSLSGLSQLLGTGPASLTCSSTAAASSHHACAFSVQPQSKPLTPHPAHVPYLPCTYIPAG